MSRKKNDRVNCMVEAIIGCNNRCAVCGNDMTVNARRLREIRENGLTMLRKDPVTGREIMGLRIKHNEPPEG